ncbi:MAG: hypothetical protein H0W46_12505, partial [Acidimicrobiia bacterium]|nr:hypothetical protein [Acidimicrobiia bacterium]
MDSAVNDSLRMENMMDDQERPAPVLMAIGRRRFLAALGGAGALAIGACSGDDEADSTVADATSPPSGAPPSSAPSSSAAPTAAPATTA